MSATGRSYTQIFFKVQYIIQAILSRKSMKKFTVTDEKIKNNGHTDLRTSHAQLLERGCQYKEEDYENKILS